MYRCPKCKAIAETPPSPAERTVECLKCKTGFRVAPSKSSVCKSSLSVNEKRKWRLWIGVAIMDLAGAYVLYYRVFEGNRSPQWSVLDQFFLITVIAITTGVVFYSFPLERTDHVWTKDSAEVEPGTKGEEVQ
jgi:hypothetical protein